MKAWQISRFRNLSPTVYMPCSRQTVPGNQRMKVKVNHNLRPFRCSRCHTRICRCCSEHQQHGSSCALEAPSQRQPWPPGIVVKLPRCDVAAYRYKDHDYKVPTASVLCPWHSQRVPSDDESSKGQSARPCARRPAALVNQPCSTAAHHTIAVATCS